MKTVNKTQTINMLSFFDKIVKKDKQQDARFANVSPYAEQMAWRAVLRKLLAFGLVTRLSVIVLALSIPVALCFFNGQSAEHYAQDVVYYNTHEGDRQFADVVEPAMSKFGYHNNPVMRGHMVSFVKDYLSKTGMTTCEQNCRLALDRYVGFGLLPEGWE